MESKNDDFIVTVLGARGSVSVSGESYTKYGGQTSSYMVEAGGKKIFIDAGTGIMRAPYVENEEIHVLLSHLHIDHLIGLPFFRPLFEEDSRVNAYAVKRENGNLEEQLNNLFVPPFWPCRLDEYKAKVNYHVPEFPFMIGDIKIDGIEGNHPGGCTIFKLTYKGRVFVYMSDYEHEEGGFKDEIVNFVKDADVLFYDGQYSEAEYEIHRAYGHSTPEQGLILKDKANVKRLYFIHHDPGHTDEYLDNETKRIDREDVRFARGLEKIVI